MAPTSSSIPSHQVQTKLREPSLGVKLLTAGTAACVADLITFPLDTAKVRLQIQGEASGPGPVRHYLTTNVTPSFGNVRNHSTAIVVEQTISVPRYKGMLGTMMTIARQEGPKNLYNGLTAGLQRQMCFASIRIGLYDSVKAVYQEQFSTMGRKSSSSENANATIPVRVCAGITTGGIAVLFAQPTDVVKVRMQAESRLGSISRYSGCMDAYKTIAQKEGLAGLWKGTVPNVSRNAIVNVAEIVCYDIFKEYILNAKLMEDGVPCHFTAAVAAGFCTTIVASPVDVVKTRYMNAQVGHYRGAIDCAYKMMVKEGPAAFYKGFVPSFSRLVSWNICMWITYEQFKRLALYAYNK